MSEVSLQAEVLCSELVYLDTECPCKVAAIPALCPLPLGGTLPAKLSDFAAGKKSFHKSQKVTYKQVRYELLFCTQAYVRIIPTPSQET